MKLAKCWKFRRTPSLDDTATVCKRSNSVWKGQRMKEMNWLETQLNSWEPRRPSARIKRRLFPTPSTRLKLAMAFNWLAPATVCMLLTLAVFKQENYISAASPRHNPAVALMLSNQSFVAYLTGGS